MSVIQELRALSKTQVGVGLLFSSLAAAGGAYAGYIYAIKNVTEQIKAEADLVLQKEIADAKAFYKRQNKAEEFATPESAFAALHPEDTSLEAAVEALKTYSAETERVPYEAVEPASELHEVTSNVFTDAKPQHFDYESELKIRDPDRPYLITLEEWSENEMDFETLNYTYFEGDGILMYDDDDSIVEDIEGTVGSHNLIRFGDGSGDDNVVFVRNQMKHLNYEISRSKGKYSVEVGGMPDSDSLAHAFNSPALRRLRGE